MFVKVDAVVLSLGHFFFVVLVDSSTRSKSLCNIKKGAKEKTEQNASSPEEKKLKKESTSPSSFSYFMFPSPPSSV